MPFLPMAACGIGSVASSIEGGGSRCSHREGAQSHPQRMEQAQGRVSGARRGFTGELRQSKEMNRMSALDSDRSAHRHSSNVQLTLVRLCSFLIGRRERVSYSSLFQMSEER